MARRTKEKLPEPGLYVERANDGTARRFVHRVTVEAVGTIQFEFLNGRPIYRTPDGKLHTSAAEAADHLDKKGAR